MKQSRSFRRILFLYILYNIICAPVGFRLAHFQNFFVGISTFCGVFEKTLKKSVDSLPGWCYDVITDGDTVENN